MHKEEVMRNFKVLIVVGLAIVLGGCARTPYEIQQGYRGQAGALGGGALGAIIGQAIGRNTTGTLMGAGAGALLGYIFGNESDKYTVGQPRRLDNGYSRNQHQRNAYQNRGGIVTEQ